MPTCEQIMLCRPMRQLWAIITRLSILVPSPMTVAVGAAVDRGIGADFDVRADLDVAQLLRKLVPAVDEFVAEAVRADDRAGVNDRARADDGVFVEHGVGKDRHVVGDLAAGQDPAPEWIVTRSPITTSSPMNAPGSMCTSSPSRAVQLTIAWMLTRRRCSSGRGRKWLTHARKGGVHIGDLNRREFLRHETLRDDDGTRSAGARR